MSNNILAQLGSGTGGQATSVDSWGGAITDALLGLWIDFAELLPKLLAALLVFFIGWAIAVAAGRLVEKMLVVLRINQAFEHLKGLKDAVERAGLKLNIPFVIGEIVKWFLIIVTLLAATDILGLQEIAGFLTAVLVYIPNVVVAALILIIAVVLGNFVYKTVVASITAAGFGSATVIAAISKWSIIVFAVLAALTQLNVATELIQTFTTAFFAMVALAGGLAFGLGGKEVAAKWLKQLEADLTGRVQQRHDEIDQGPRA